MNEQLLLKMQHGVVYSHTEEWFLLEDGNLLVKSDCPRNHPRKMETTCSLSYALRQLGLMTTPREGWRVVTSTDAWHELLQQRLPGEE
jgi:hypothetical protein